MNQHQRKFLLEQIESQYKTELGELNKRRPVPPSLNNYLIADILDGTAKLREQGSIRDAIRERVRDLGKDDALVQHSSNRWGRTSDEHLDHISLPVLLLFEEPERYRIVRENYERAMMEWEQEKKLLESSISAMRIKVQVGSDKALSSLVEQADKLCSMSLTASSRLLLPGCGE